MNATIPETTPARARVRPNQRHAFGGVWRLTFRRWCSLQQLLVVAGMLALLAVVAGASIPRGDAAEYFDWVSSVYLGVVVPVLAFLSGAGAIREDLKGGSVDYLFTRPVRRTAFVVFRYLSHLACTQLTYALALGVLAAVGVFRQVPDLAAGLPLLVLAQLITITAFLALGFFCAVLVARYLIIGLLYAGLIEVGVGQIPTQLSGLSMTRQVRELLDPLVRSTTEVTMAGAFATSLSLLTFAVVFVAAAALIFSMKEFSGTSARE
jgi:ABC-2 type transport system permease protein